MAHLDEFDRKILKLLQSNSRRTGNKLAEQVGLSAAACLRRVQRLRETGAIEREVAIIAPKVLGQHLTVIASVTMDSENTQYAKAFRQRMRSLDEVITCHHITGSVDYVMTLHLADMAEYREFVDLHFCVPEIRRYDTTVVLETIK